MGQTGQALRSERENVQRDLSYLKQAASLPNAHVICGAGGTFIHLGWITVSTFAPISYCLLMVGSSTSPALA